MEIIEKVPNSYITVKVVFLVSHNQRRTYMGKCWPKTTQCVVYQNDRIVSIGEVVKHERDKDNPQFARIQAAKKAFKKLLWKELRTKLWKKILELDGSKI